MKIVIIDYGAGNIQSLKFGLERLGYSAVLSSDKDIILAADRVIFPGVGEASSAMKKLRKTGLDKVIPELKQPVLGICLGMQLMCNFCEEGETRGLGIFDIDVIRFNTDVKIPQIGWNQVTDLKSPIFSGIKENEFMYLVHSYYVPDCPQAISKSNYGINYTTAIKKDNFYGVQFHPEKSSTAGSKLIENFIKKTS